MKNRSRVEVRPATDRDLDAVVAVFRRCWTQSYVDLLPASLLDRLDEDASRAMWQQALHDSPHSTALVAVDGDEIVGVTRFSADGTSGEVDSLYVSPAAQGQGTGRLLLTTAADGLAAGGVRDATLWVFAANEPARAFYERLGWTPDGTTRVQERFGERELRLRRSLAGGT